MPMIKIVTGIRADPKRCFDLSRDIDLHLKSLEQTGEKAVAGKMSGLLSRGEEVTWQGRHFGLVIKHTSRITVFDPPWHFCDEMTKGKFKSFRHDHYFIPIKFGTRMIDILKFETPWSILGQMANELFLARYLERLLQTRNAAIKKEAETRVQLEGAS